MIPEAKLRDNVIMLLNQIGEPSHCKGTAGVVGCGASIWWITHRNGTKAPYTCEGVNHFIDCPKAEEIRKARKAQKEAEAAKNFGSMEGQP